MTKPKRLVVLQSTDQNVVHKAIDDEAEKILNQQLLAADSYDFGQHFNQISDYKEEKRAKQESPKIKPGKNELSEQSFHFSE